MSWRTRDSRLCTLLGCIKFSECFPRITFDFCTYVRKVLHSRWMKPSAATGLSVSVLSLDLAWTCSSMAGTCPSMAGTCSSAAWTRCQHNGHSPATAHTAKPSTRPIVHFILSTLMTYTCQGQPAKASQSKGGLGPSGLGRVRPVNPCQKLYSPTKVSSQTPPGRTRDEPARKDSD